MKRPLGLVCLFFVLFIRLFYVCFPPVLPDYSDLKGREVYINGQVISIKTQELNGELQTVYTLDKVSLAESQNTKDNSGTKYVHDKIYCYTSIANTNIHIGSRVWVKGTFMPQTPAENPGQFDSQFYYHMQGIGAGLQEAELVWYDTEQDALQGLLQNFKAYFIQKIDTYFTPKYGGVMKTILLGDKADLDKDLKQLFQEGGILHILTISGLHISMLGMGSFRILRKIGVPLKASAVTGLLIVIFYGAMIGTGAATFRAICMFTMQMAAILLGRTYDRLTGLSVAAILLLLEQPMYVFYSGFLLSFGAVLGVTVLSPMVEQFCKDRGTFIERAGKLFSGGIGILLATFPIQLYSYYEYQIYSMLINVLVLPFLPCIVGFGAIVLAVPQVLSVAALPFVYGCQGLLFAYEWVCLQSQKLPWHCLVLGAPGAWQIMIYYGCLLLWIAWVKYDRKEPVGKQKRVQGVKRTAWHLSGVIAPACFLLSAILLLWRPVEGLTCRFLSVGQGDCAMLQYGDETYVVDCGSTSRSNVGTQVLLPCLKYYGVSEVSGIFLSHADGDHMNGILQWLEDYEHSHVKIGTIILPGLSKEALSEEFGELLQLAETWAIPVITLGAGDRLDIGALTIDVMHPQKECRDTEDANAYSQVLLFSYHGQGILMTGDIGAEQERTLLDAISAWKKEGAAGEDRGEKHIALLKAAHHGSKYSGSIEFLEACSPEHAVLSYGTGNQYGHPHKDTINRLEAVHASLWYTGRQGAIQCILKENNLIMESYPFH